MQRLGVSIDSDLPHDAATGDSLGHFVATIVEGAAAVNRELYLILDDYQHVADPRAHRLMQKLLDHSPDNLHFVIAARVQPPLSLGRLRLMGQLIEVDCADLPFDLAETRAFLELNSGSLKLTADEVHQLHDLTGGWPASLQLIAILTRSRPYARESLQELGWKTDNLQSYLAEDVMAHLPPELADFMECISLCRRFNASLAATISGQENARDMLTRLEEENLLIFRVEGDDRRLWYRFHPLFGEFLTARLARREPEEVARLHRLAAGWLADQGLFAEAVRHAIDGGDLDFAADIIERIAPSSWGLDYLSPLLRLLERLPREVLYARPRLFFLACLTYSLTARAAKAEAWLEEFLRSEASSQPDVAHRMPLVQAAIEIQRDRSESAIGLLEDYVPLPDDYPMMRYGHPAILGQAYAASGRHAEAQRCFEAVTIAEDDQDDEMALVMAATRIRCEMLLGRAAEVARQAEPLLAHAGAVHGHRSRSTTLAAALMAESCYELDRIDESREALANRTAVFQSTVPPTMIGASICRARLDLLQESAAVALDFLDHQEQLFRRFGLDRAAVHCLAEQSRILLLGDDFNAARQRVEQLESIAARHPDARGFSAEMPILAALVRARLHLATGEAETALEDLDKVRAFAEANRRGQLQVTADLLTAMALDLLGRDTDAPLLEALALGQRLGLVRTFVDEGPRVAALLTSLDLPHAEQKELATYRGELLKRYRHDDEAGQGEGAHPAAEKAVLTPREIAILQLISEAMTNKRIALTLNISLETVKWNLKNIYIKLGVSSRYDAMSWARKHGLIS
ncbi:HTH-type transcriptional regulator MalT [compost metagenome]